MRKSYLPVRGKWGEGHGFEQGLEGWSWGSSDSSGTAQVITDPTRAHSGNNYLQLSATTAASTSAGQIISVNPGDQLTFGGWAYIETGSASATGVAWDIAVLDANGNVLAYDGSAVTTQGAWTYLSTNYTVPTGGASVSLYCQIYQPTGAITARFDDAFLTGASGAGVHYYHADHLGSARLMTDSGGNVTWSATYLPFGQEWNPQATTNHYKFTGQERDSESGNDNFVARYYGSSLGRWLSPDAINLTDERAQNPANTLNKYVYGGNNPLKYIDPDGRDITFFYTNTGPVGHFFAVAWDQSTGDYAVLNFGPRDQTASARTDETLGIAVPGNTNYSSHITSADELKQDFTSLTIQTNPEDTQKAIAAINAYNSVPHEYMTYQQNCTTVCRDIANQVLGLKSTSIIPKSLWGDIFKKSSNAALNRAPGSKPPGVQSKHGLDYGQPRYGMNTFDFIWLLLHPQKACVTTLAPNGNGGVTSVKTCS